MKRATFFGHIEHDGMNARLIIPEKDQIAQVAWEKLEGTLLPKNGRLYGRVMVRLTIIEDDPGKESSDQRYYWHIVLDDITQAMNSLGNRWSKQETHDKLKEMFAPRIKGFPTTKQMGKREFKDYVEKCCQFAADFLGKEVRPKVNPANMPTE